MSKIGHGNVMHAGTLHNLVMMIHCAEVVIL